MLNYDPRTGRLELAGDDMTAVSIGSVISARLDAPIAVQQLEIRAEPDKARIGA